MKLAAVVAVAAAATLCGRVPASEPASDKKVGSEIESTSGVRIGPPPPGEEASKEPVPLQGLKMTTASARPERATTGGISCQEMVLALAVLVAGAILILGLFKLRHEEKINQPLFAKLATVFVVCQGSLFIIAAGWGQEQFTPIVGLFGTALGYFLGAPAVKGGSAEPGPRRAG